MTKVEVIKFQDFMQPKLGVIQGIKDIGGNLLEGYNNLADKIVGWEVETILAPLGNQLTEWARALLEALTNVMPEIGAGITVICAVGIMLTGNVPKWATRWGMAMIGVIVWLLNAHS